MKDTFGIPRQWYIFNGRVTKPIEYFASIAQGFAGVNLLDVWLNFHYDDRLQIKAGRFFVPFTYEPYVIPIHALITPEWSLFFNNFEPNRDLGVMAWGQLARQAGRLRRGRLQRQQERVTSTPTTPRTSSASSTRSRSARRASPRWKTSTSAARSSSAARSNAPNPPDAQDDRLDPGQRDDRRPVPVVQRQRPRVGRAPALVAPRGVFLPAPLADRRVGRRFPGLHAAGRATAGPACPCGASTSRPATS